ncbi:hypothetical protein [Oleiagrimonas sp. MCCC 1A03011]|uniref:hypothetical protein n=1 Tax=Oleiagrimonas sp. MCCC 1A03011 TaxID=1926883 RepID=UPI000DC26D4F|nr:hypothetical protein [Oleiagrimonas sp. MCCC 1A03011]RAP57089.1 hypothetical protein BTJ49_10955 [Oleiagrimonas sp. MCCC 1A03011]
MASKNKENETHPDFDERIAEGAERLKERESAALHATRDAVVSGTERTERALHRATDATASAAQRTHDRAARLGEKGQEKWAEGRDYAEQSLDRVFDYVRENPGKSLAMAVAGGWLLGSILRRR